MIKSGEAYQAAITGDTRQMLIRAVVDIIDPDMVHTGASQGNAVYYSQPTQLTDKIFTARDTTVTLERNRWVLDGSKRYPPQDDEVGSVGKDVSGDDCNFATAQWAEIQFSNVSILQACSVYFSEHPDDGVPEDFTVEVRQNGTAFYTATVTGNTATSASFRGFTVYDPDAIRITVTKWSRPSRRMRIVEIIPGVYEQWGNDVIASFSLVQQSNFTGLALPYGTCNLRMDNQDRRFEPRSKTGVFQSLEERQGIGIEIGVRLEDGTDEYKPMGTYYQHSGGWRTGDNGLTMQWILVDIVGLLSDREYFPPDTLPTTLEGWVQSLVAQLGDNFKTRYSVDENYANAEVIANSREDVTGKSCGDILRYVCQATGTFPRAGNESGALTVEPYWYEGNKYTLDNLQSYPTMSANSDLAAMTFTIYPAGEETEELVLAGNVTGSGSTVRIDNPFLHDRAQALSVARQILTCYGGNKITTTGRGDPSSEIGDVDTVWLNESSATTARRMMQSFKITDGVMLGCQSELLQASGGLQYTNREIITPLEGETLAQWTVPDGVTQLRLIIVGPGETGGNGTAGTWETEGETGADGSGGKVWSGTINVNAGATYIVDISWDGTIFGAYSSNNGNVYTNGYTDILTGDSYARTGVAAPLSGSGDGGEGGAGGAQGNRHQATRTIYVQEKEDWIFGVNTAPFVPKQEAYTQVDNYPGTGEAGAAGALGCVVIYWDKEDEA